MSHSRATITSHNSDMLDGYHAEDFVMQNGLLIPISAGGTGANTVAGARNALGLGNTDGPVPIANGGTGQTTAALARNALGLGNTDGPVPIANGGTGQATVALARNALGLGNTDGALPVANGGTGAGTAQDACTNIQAIPNTYLDTDGALTANSDVKIATQQATKEYVDNALGGLRYTTYGIGYGSANTVATAVAAFTSTGLYIAFIQVSGGGSAALQSGMILINVRALASANTQRTTVIACDSFVSATVNASMQLVITLNNAAQRYLQFDIFKLHSS